MMAPALTPSSATSPREVYPGTSTRRGTLSSDDRSCTIMLGHVFLSSVACGAVPGDIV